MSLILSIETTTKACSVTLSEAGKLISIQESVEDAFSHSRLLTVYIQNLFLNTEYELKDIQAVAISKGPGSYTGLRIGVSTAKGIAYGLKVPLISIDTLQAMAFGISENKTDVEALFCSMTDARRLEVYAAIFNNKNESIRKTQADIIDETSYSEYLKDKKVFFFGDGSEKCKELLNHKNAEFIDGIYPSAKDMVILANEKFINKDFEDVAYFEPFYLKDFVASVPTKNIYV